MGRGFRGFAVRVMGLPFLVLGLVFGYQGVVSGILDPIEDTTAGVLEVENCPPVSEGQKRGKYHECKGLFTPNSSAGDRSGERDHNVSVETGEYYPKGHRLEVVRVGGTHATSVLFAVAAGLRYLFGGLFLLGIGLFFAITGRGMGFRAGDVLRPLPTVVSWFTLRLTGIALVGFVLSVMLS